MALHIINKSPFQASAFSDCLQIYRQGDTVLLIEDGVYAAVANTTYSQCIQECGVPIYALKADVLARGLGDTLIKDAILISDDAFVALTVEHSIIQSWY